MLRGPGGRFLPGTAPGPGQPRRRSLDDELREALGTLKGGPQAFAKTVLEVAMGHRVATAVQFAAMRLVFERAEGRARLAKELDDQERRAWSVILDADAAVEVKPRRGLAEQELEEEAAEGEVDPEAELEALDGADPEGQPRDVSAEVVSVARGDEEEAAEADTSADPAPLPDLPPAQFDTDEGPEFSGPADWT